MTPNDRARDVEPGQPDGLTPEQLRRFRVWRAMAGLAQAQAGGRLTTEQARLLESLAESLQQLAGQLSLLAELGEQCVQVLDAGRTSPGLAPGPTGGPLPDRGREPAPEAPREP
jgi:hypothetical protein